VLVEVFSDSNPAIQDSLPVVSTMMQ
jgi:hypothetical protein